MRRLFPALAFVAGVLAMAAWQPAVAGGPLAERLDRVVSRMDSSDIRAADVRAVVNRLLPLQSFHGGVSEEKIHDLAREAMQGVIDTRLKLADAKRRGV
ncbi:MAG: hypothetical protein MAG794_00881 [Gammaproteobacteria bacterium]|nr:hypothetical protein [Gammaproteobacteria bacterium]